MTQLTFTNQATFQINLFHTHAMSDWIAGDILELSHGFSSVNFLMPTQLRDGLLILVPTVRITNTTRNSEITAHLISVPTLDLLTISSMDLSTCSVTLSDATIWTIFSDDMGLLNMWKIGDEILVGSNMGFKRSTYEAILLNAPQQSLARAHQ